MKELCAVVHPGKHAIRGVMRKESLPCKVVNLICVSWGILEDVYIVCALLRWGSLTIFFGYSRYNYVQNNTINDYSRITFFACLNWFFF